MNFITDFLFPNRCLQCNSIIESKEVICEECYDKIDFTHWEYFEENALHQKLNPLFNVSDTYALMNFEKEGLSRKIIHQLKYAGRENIGKRLAEWTTEKIQLKQKPDLLINIPVHSRKLKKRGYNQLHLFTETLSDIWNIPHQHNYLKKVQYHDAQARKSRRNRLENKDIISIPLPVQNTHFLLIDDVCTTGNTLASCARKILETPGNKVSILVMAID